MIAGAENEARRRTLLSKVIVGSNGEVTSHLAIFLHDVGPDGRHSVQFQSDLFVSTVRLLPEELRELGRMIGEVLS